jgi:hypothetical protein
MHLSLFFLLFLAEGLDVVTNDAVILYVETEKTRQGGVNQKVQSGKTAVAVYKVLSR